MHRTQENGAGGDHLDIHQTENLHALITGLHAGAHPIPPFLRENRCIIVSAAELGEMFLPL